MSGARRSLLKVGDVVTEVIAVSVVFDDSLTSSLPQNDTSTIRNTQSLNRRSSYGFSVANVNERNVPKPQMSAPQT